MENATKALLIAGGILIALVILTIGINLYSLFNRQSKEYAQTISNTEIQKFNSKFAGYAGRKDIRPQEVISVVNLAKEYNNTVTVKIGGIKVNNKNSEKFITDNLNALYTCKTNDIKYDDEGVVKEINFTKNT